MKFIRGLTNLTRQQECIATIGNFDGVHLGHQSVIEQLKDYSKKQGLPTSIVIFEPQPIEFFTPGNAPSRLTRLRDKLELFDYYGIDRVVCLRFDRGMANQDAAEFVKNILFERIGIKCLVIGDDFHFGKNRQGNFELLKRIGKEKGFDVIATSSFYIDGERVSSTLIRDVLCEGNIEKAKLLLGRPYRISGRVVHGEKRGKRLGYPTANIELDRYQSPIHGIFTVRVYGIDHFPLNAVAYVGTRPVFQGDRMMLEVHLLDFDEDIYGKRLEVELISKIREEGYFDSEEQLLRQMEMDIKQARKEFLI